MPPPRGKGRFSKDRKPKRNQQSLLFRRKRFCRFTVAGVEQIDYKDVDTLRDFIGENGKITPARLTGTRAFFQPQQRRLLLLAPVGQTRLGQLVLLLQLVFLVAPGFELVDKALLRFALVLQGLFQLRHLGIGSIKPALRCMERIAGSVMLCTCGFELVFCLA